MKTYMTPEEHARLHRRRARQTLGLLIAVLALVGIVTVVRAGVKGVATLFDDTQQKAEYEDRLEGLVLFDPLPFDGIENIDDLTLREAAVWGCVYSIQETQGSFDNYNTDPDTEQLLLPSVDVDAYLAKLVGPSFKLTHKSFEMDDMKQWEWNLPKRHSYIILPEPIRDKTVTSRNIPSRNTGSPNKERLCWKGVSNMVKKKRKHGGHYCKVCGCHKSNESFSGRGHALHICKAYTWLRTQTTGFQIRHPDYPILHRLLLIYRPRRGLSY